MTSQSPSQQILAQLSNLAVAFATHVASEADMKKQVDGMYKILVTGNGIPPLPETVRQHSEWITERDKEQSEDKADRKDVAAQNKKDTREDRNEALSFKHQFWLVILVQVVTLLVVLITHYWK